MSTLQKPRVDDEDLDDLDDVLDQFTPAPTKQPSTVNMHPSGPSPAAPTAASTVLQPSSSRSPPSVSDADELTNGIAEDFARELAKGMESLMREMDGGDLVMEDVLGNGEVGKNGLDGTGEKGDFQKTIRHAMEKLKESESTLQGDSTPANLNADSFEAMLAQLGAAGDGESEEELHGLLETMMSQLMSKEVLYEPLKELHDKFPAHLRDHPELPAEEKERYQSQYQSISKMIALFDDPGYKDDDPRVVELMTEMQSFGSPPPEIMGPMPPGFGFGPDGIPQMPEGCVVA